MTEENPKILIHNNQVWFEGEIASADVHHLMFEINKINGKVEFFVSSNGGSSDASLGFYDFLNINHSRITVIAHSSIASAATDWLFSKCKTLVYPSLEIMFHPMRWGVYDRVEALEGAVHSVNSRLKLIDEVHLSKGFSCDWRNKTLYFYAKEFVERNIVDGFYEG